ncbi:RNA polymerase sigma factor SigM [Nocardioides aequoreus]|uniref:RNA polymerase sigma factor SigM n=1 Tax=Nocardioides aequoreus TaxID=397278 RepID=UPI0004C427DB|nr:RNA polymerase sigma factor SigM [Nocardioides aequoreus]
MTATSGEQRDDAALLRAHVEGDPDAFGALVLRHRDRLWAVALRTTGHPEEAADALQDALVAAYRRAGSFRGDAQVTTWLHRIVVNACLDRLRRARVRRAEPLPDDLDERHDLLPDPTDVDEPLQRVLDADLRERVHAALRELPEEQRLCLVLVDLEGWSVAEAAARLEVPPGTVKSRCHRGRARLATLLADLSPASEGGEEHPGGTTTRPGTSDSRDPQPRKEADRP